MKKILGLIAIVAIALMLIPLFAPMVHGGGPPQPPIITKTFWEGTIGWGPVDADPAIAYDTASGELLFNSMQGLLAFKGETYSQFIPTLATNEPTRADIRIIVTNTSAVGADPTGTTWDDGANTYTCTGWVDEGGNGFNAGDVIYLHVDDTIEAWTVESIVGLGTATITLHLWRGSYTFNIRNGTFVNTTAINFNNPIGSHWVEEFTGDVYTVTGWEHLTSTLSIGDNLTVTGPGLWRQWAVNDIEVTPNDPIPGITEVEITICIYFYGYDGNIVGTFTYEDVVYSLQRGLVLDPPGQPFWMYDKPLFDLSDHTGFDNSTAMDLAMMIDDAIVGDPGSDEGVETPPTVTIYVGCKFPDNAFKQILSNTWGCIEDKEFYISKLNWDGLLYTTTKYGGPQPDWWIDWAGEGGGMNYADDDPADQMDPTMMAGTGPFHVSLIDDVSLVVQLRKNFDFWQGWPARLPTGVLCNDSLDTVEIDYIATWTVRKNMFNAGEIDTCAVPRAVMFELLDANKNPINPKHTTVSTIIPPLAMDANHLQYNIRADTTYVGSGSLFTPSLGAGIPLDFFNNTYTRKAFAYSFDWATYGTQAYYGESDYRQNPFVLGLFPDYYNVAGPSVKYPLGIPFYYANLTLAMQNLQAAMFWNGTGYMSVWNTGFTLDITFNTGNDVRHIACTMIQSFFQTLSTFGPRAGSGKPPFTVNIKEIDWTTTIRGMTRRLLPIFDIGWLADFADADDFIRPYMHSGGTFAFFQNYTAANNQGVLKDLLIDQAVLTPDGPARAALYRQLQEIYYEDCPSFPVNIPRGRRFCQYWVKGWYFDAVYPSTYFYTIWKQDDCWGDVSGATAGVSDGANNMFDIAWLIAHFNGGAPVPGYPIDPKWVGVYGANGAVDTYGDRKCNMKDIAFNIAHFNHKMNTNTP
jgi:peptide/nickel transport system substrate-binding protein